MGNDSNLVQFRLVAAVALADGTLDDAERQVLLGLAGELGLNRDDADELLDELVAKKGEAEVKIPEDRGERQRLFKALVEVIGADGSVDDKELAFVRRIAPKFGLHEIEAEDMVLALASSRKKGKGSSQRLKPPQ